MLNNVAVQCVWPVAIKESSWHASCRHDLAAAGRAGILCVRDWNVKCCQKLRPVKEDDCDIRWMDSWQETEQSNDSRSDSTLHFIVMLPYITKGCCICCSDWIYNGADDAFSGGNHCMADCSIGSSWQFGFVYRVCLLLTVMLQDHIE